MRVTWPAVPQNSEFSLSDNSMLQSICSYIHICILSMQFIKLRSNVIFDIAMASGIRTVWVLLEGK